MDFTKEGRISLASYAVRYWLTDLAADDPTSSRVRARVFTALQRAGIPFAIPTEIHRVELNDEAQSHRRAEERGEQRFAALRAEPLFKVLNDDEVRTLAVGLSHVIYAAGETVTRQGAVAHWLYVLTRGEVEVRATLPPENGDGPPVQKVVNHLVAPAVFGEMGMMTGAPRVADVVALTDVDCFRLDKVTFERVIRERPDVAQELSGLLAERRMKLLAARDDLDDSTKEERVAGERDRILTGIRSFFGL